MSPWEALLSPMIAVAGCLVGAIIARHLEGRSPRDHEKPLDK